MQAQPDTEGAGAWLQIAHAMQERTSREHHHPSRHTVIRGDGSRLPAVEPPPPPAGCEVIQVGGLPNPSERVATARRARHQARLSTRASVGTNLEAVAAVAAAIPLAADDGVHACCLSDPEARCPTLVNKTNWWGHGAHDGAHVPHACAHHGAIPSPTGGTLLATHRASATPSTSHRRAHASM